MERKIKSCLRADTFLELQFSFHGYKPFFETQFSQGGLAQVVERSICIREAPGSIPGFSSFGEYTKMAIYIAEEYIGRFPDLRARQWTLFLLVVAYKHQVLLHVKTAATRD